MSFQEQQDCWNLLFSSISKDIDNENEIIRLLDEYNKNFTNFKEIINCVSKQNRCDESMLMWAVWRMKKNVVIKLIEIGANPRFISHFGESVATYWNDSTIQEKGEDAALEIATVLHQNGVKLDLDSCNSYSIVKRARVHGYNKLSEGLKQLGY